MTLRRALVVAVPLLLGTVGFAWAQWPSQQAPAQPFGAPSQPFGAPAQPQEPPCMKEFLPLRTEAEKKADAIRTASQRKTTPKEACGLFAALVVAEAKMVKFTIANAASCGIPLQVVDQMKNSHKQTTAMRSRICQAAANPPQQAGPSLGEALGTSRVPDASNVKPGRGTFDTLTGTPLGAK